MAEVERYESVIGVSYQGTADVDRYLADLQRLGAVSEEQGRRIRGSLTAGGDNGRELRAALGITGGSLTNYARDLNTATASQDAASRSAKALENNVRSLASAMLALRAARDAGVPVGAPGAVGIEGAARRSLYRLVEAQRVQQQFAPSPPPLPTPVRAPLALGTAEQNRADAAARTAAAQRAAAAVRQPIALPAPQKTNAQIVAEARAEAEARLRASGSSGGSGGGGIGGGSGGSDGLGGPGGPLGPGGISERVERILNERLPRPEDPLKPLRAASEKAARTLNEVQAKVARSERSGFDAEKPTRFANETEAEKALLAARRAQIAADNRLGQATDRRVKAANAVADADAARAAQDRIDAQTAANRAARTDVGGYRGEVDNLLQLASGTDPRVVDAKSKVEEARLNAERVAARADVPLGAVSGGVRGFADLEQRTQELAAAQRRLSAATTRLSTTEARVERELAGNPGFASNFRRGLTGERNSAPFGEQVGQTVKFSLLYGGAYQLLSGFTRTLAATVQEGIQFQQAVTQLKLATGDTSDRMNELAQTVGDSAASYGFAPSQGVEAAARGIGLYGATQADFATQSRVGQIASEVTSRLALTSGLEPSDIQANISAVTNAFGGGAEGAYRVADLDQYFSQKFGVAPGSALQAVAEAGSVASSAGFSQEETNAIAALLQGRTGQTPSAVAGYMAQIFSRGGEGSLGDVVSRFGVDPNSSLRDQLYGLSDVYGDASGNERNQIAAAFGRGKVQNAVTVLLDNINDIDAAAQEAQGAEGSSRRAADLKTSDIGGQLQVTLGAMREFANQLGQTGILAGLGAAAIAFREIVEAGTNVLRLFNSLDPALRALLITLAAGAAANRLGAGSALASTLGIGRANPAGFGLAASGARTITSARTGATVALASRAGAGAVAANLAAGAASLINPITLAVGGLLAVGAIKGAVDRYTAASDLAANLLANSDLTSESTPDDYRARATALRESAEDVRSSTGKTATLFGRSDELVAQAGALEGQAASLDATAKRLEDNATTPGQVYFDNLDTEGIAEGFSRMTSAGSDAERRLKLLNDAIEGTGTAAEQAREGFDVGAFAGLTEDALRDALSGVEGKKILDPSVQGGGLVQGELVGNDRVQGPNLITDPNFNRDELLANFDPATVIRTVNQKLDGRSIGELSDDEVSGLADELLATQGVTRNSVDARSFDEQKAKVLAFLTGERDSLRELIKGANSLTDEQVTAAFDALVTGTQEALGNLDETDFSGRIARLRTAVRRGTRYNQLNRGGTRTTQAQLDKLRSDLAAAQVDELENLRRVAQQNADPDDVGGVGRRFLRREIRVAVKGGAQDQLVELIGSTGAYAKDLAVQAIKDAIAVQRAAVRAYGNYDEALIAGGINQAREGGRPEVDPELFDALKAARNAVSGTRDGDRFRNGNDVPGLDGAAADKAASDRLTRAQREALRAASSIDPDDTVGQARNALASAQADLDAAKDGSTDYYDALGRVHQAQRDLGDTIQSRSAAFARANVDPDDTVAAAATELEIARAALAAAKPGTERYATALADVRSAEDSYAESLAERTSAIAQARASRIGGEIASAKAGIIAAKAALDEATPGTVAYFQALDSLFQSQDALSAAVREYQSNVRLANIDATNPLLVARNDLQTALAQQRADADAGKDVRAADRVATQQAQANLEATKFSQRLESVQTAEQLGRISHQAYIRYLTNEQSRLESIKNRTFQQQQQLNQIDGLLQDAAKELQGQFNFGDIKLPTPYQVRRYVQETTGGDALARGPQTLVQQTNTNIQIDGADTRKVRQVVEDVIGRRARTTTNAPRRRV